MLSLSDMGALRKKKAETKEHLVQRKPEDSQNIAGSGKQCFNSKIYW